MLFPVYPICECVYSIVNAALVTAIWLRLSSLAAASDEASAGGDDGSAAAAFRLETPLPMQLLLCAASTAASVAFEAWRSRAPRVPAGTGAAAASSSDSTSQPSAWRGPHSDVLSGSDQGGACAGPSAPTAGNSSGVRQATLPPSPTVRQQRHAAAPAPASSDRGAATPPRTDAGAATDWLVVPLGTVDEATAATVVGGTAPAPAPAPAGSGTMVQDGIGDGGLLAAGNRDVTVSISVDGASDVRRADQQRAVAAAAAFASAAATAARRSSCQGSAAAATATASGAAAAAAGLAVRSLQRTPYVGRVRLVTTHVKIRGADPERLEPGYVGRLEALAAARGQRLLGVCVRPGCIEIVLDSTDWADGDGGEPVDSAVGPSGSWESAATQPLLPPMAPLPSVAPPPIASPPRHSSAPGSLSGSSRVPHFGWDAAVAAEGDAVPGLMAEVADGPPSPPGLWVQLTATQTGHIEGETRAEALGVRYVPVPIAVGRSSVGASGGRDRSGGGNGGVGGVGGGNVHGSYTNVDFNTLLSANNSLAGGGGGGEGGETDADGSGDLDVGAIIRALRINGRRGSAAIDDGGGGDDALPTEPNLVVDAVEYGSTYGSETPYPRSGSSDMPYPLSSGSVKAAASSGGSGGAWHGSAERGRGGLAPLGGAAGMGPATAAPTAATRGAAPTFQVQTAPAAQAHSLLQTQPGTQPPISRQALMLGSAAAADPAAPCIVTFAPRVIVVAAAAAPTVGNGVETAAAGGMPPPPLFTAVVQRRHAAAPAPSAAAQGASAASAAVAAAPPPPPLELTLRARGEYLPSRVARIASVPVAATAATAAAADDAAPQVDASPYDTLYGSSMRYESYAIELLEPLRQPGLLLADARVMPNRSGSTQAGAGAPHGPAAAPTAPPPLPLAAPRAVPLVAVPSAAVAAELQAAIEAWDGGAAELDDFLLDLGTWTHHVSCQTSLAAAATPPTGLAPTLPPLDPRLASLGGHLLGYAAACGWAATAATLAAELAQFGLIAQVPNAPAVAPDVAAVGGGGAAAVPGSVAPGFPASAASTPAAAACVGGASGGPGGGPEQALLEGACARGQQRQETQGGGQRQAQREAGSPVACGTGAVNGHGGGGGLGSWLRRRWRCRADAAAAATTAAAATAGCGKAESSSAAVAEAAATAGEAAEFATFKASLIAAQSWVIQVLDVVSCAALLARGVSSGLELLSAPNLLTLIACSTGAATAAARLAMPYELWVRLAEAAKIPRHVAYCITKFLIGVARWPPPPGIVSYELGPAMFVFEGIIIPGSCLLSPAAAAAVAAAKVPLYLAMWYRLHVDGDGTEHPDLPYGGAAADAAAEEVSFGAFPWLRMLLRALAISGMSVAVTVACHANIAAAFARRQRRLRRKAPAAAAEKATRATGEASAAAGLSSGGAAGGAKAALAQGAKGE